MWDLPRQGLEPVSPALAGRLSTTVPPGKPPLLPVLIETTGSSLIEAGPGQDVNNNLGNTVLVLRQARLGNVSMPMQRVMLT